VTWRWGRAGVRLTPDEADARRRAALARRNRARLSREADDAIAYRLWRAGRVIPYRITLALDAADLHGPTVDEMLGGAEPMVDEWEAGIRYPSWKQLVALAELTRKTPRFFAAREPMIDPARTSLRFHGADAAMFPPPVWEFTPDAIAEAVTGA
jgi:hypothetical protein